MFKPARRLIALGFLVMAAAMLAGGLGSTASAQVPYANLLFREPRYAAIVVDANTGEVLYDKNADSPRYPASISKIMTLYLTFEALSTGRLHLTDSIVVSPHAASMAPTKLGLRPGDTVTVDEAIRAMTVKSANDMAVAMAEKIGGSEARFAALMTLRAQELGMANTQFVNASGLPDARQLSSARDIAILSRSVMRDYPQFYHYFGLHSFTFRGQTIMGHNHILDAVPGADGLKTGYTNASGFNLAASAVQNGRRLIAVVMGGSSTAARDANAADLLNAGFTTIRRRDLGEKITVADNLFEPDASGPIERPPVEQGDADQQSLKIVVDHGMQPIPDAPRAAKPAVLKAAARTVCDTVKTTRTVKRHGRHVKVTETSRKCQGDRPTPVSDARPCKTVKAKGRHHKAVTKCAAPAVETVADAGHGRHGKAALREDGGDWLVQVGAFRQKAQAKTQLATLSRKYSAHFAKADADVGDKVDGQYRARFSGLSASQAQEACSALRAHGHGCVVLPAG